MGTVKITHTLKLMACASFALFIVNCVLLVHQYQVVGKFVSKNIYLHDKDNPDLEKLPVDFERVAMTIEPNDRFSLIDDEAWANTLPPKHGFVRLGPEGRVFAVSLYHQLHCLNVIRFSYTVARDGEVVTDPELLRKRIGHDNHCFQFIRQSIQCKADNSLVPIQTNRNVSLAAMGFGNTRRCQNWEQVRRFVIGNDAKWKGIPFFNETSGRHVE